MLSFYNCKAERNGFFWTEQKVNSGGASRSECARRVVPPKRECCAFTEMSLEHGFSVSLDSMRADKIPFSSC